MDLIYHEAENTGPPHSPHPPPLPKRNSVLLTEFRGTPNSDYSLYYGADTPSQLLINIPGRPRTASARHPPLTRALTLSSATSSPHSVYRRPSLPATLAHHQLVTHELSRPRPLHTPASGDESFILETKEYVHQIRDRRHQLQGTLMREHPGDRLRKILGYKIEQRLVKVLSARKSRTITRRRQKKRGKSKEDKVKRRRSVKKTFRVNFNRKIPRFLRRLHRQTKKLIRLSKQKTSMNASEYEDNFDEDFPSDIEALSRSPTPRFIVDRNGMFCWPPIKYVESAIVENDESLLNPVIEEAADPSADIGIENFTLGSPLTHSSDDTPRVLGWLEVKSDSHVFTPAVATSNQPPGPFRKAPFHENMQILKTNI